MASGIKAGGIDTKAAQLRRLWRGHDTNLRCSGLAMGRPVLATKEQSALRRPAHGVTARELIAMARAARAGSVPAASESYFDTPAPCQPRPFG
jgi:hypothetical protein